MHKLSTALVALSAFALAGCDIDDLLPDIFADDRLEEGAWAFEISSMTAHGDCAGEFEDEAIEDLEMYAMIRYSQDNRLVVDLEGMPLHGVQEGDHIFVEAQEYYDVAVAEPMEDESEDHGESTEGEDAPPPSDYGSAEAPEAGVYVYLDGHIISPTDLAGGLIVEDFDHSYSCSIEATYSAVFLGEGGLVEPDMPMEDTDYDTTGDE